VNTARPQIAARELLHVVMLVMRTVAAEMRRSRRPLAPTQMGSLMRIAAGPCTMSDLARHQAVSLPTISKSVGMLVRRGWLERWGDAHDRRQSIVRLTPRGRRVLADIQQRAERHVTETLAPLAPAERAQLIAALRMLTGVLSVPGDDRCAPRAVRP
jgi:MarR family transcriptional regulator, lower aerobic nicotinate degradation pathway regulator